MEAPCRDFIPLLHINQESAGGCDYFSVNGCRRLLTAAGIAALVHPVYPPIGDFCSSPRIPHKKTKAVIFTALKSLRQKHR
jgi:hypothetical protein